MTTTEVYWLTRLDNIQMAAQILIFLGASVLLGGIIDRLATYRPDTEEKRRAALLTRWGAAVSAVCLATLIFVPTTKDMVAIYGISYLTQNKDAREIPAQALKVLNDQLKELAK